jgi:ubiquinone/menaquinone biosynthesis C-methylase UbiE
MKTVNTGNVAAYRERGLEVCADPTNEKYLLPDVPTGARRILDVGCHAGHLLESMKLPRDCEIFGCDINAEALVLARKCLPHGTFNYAKAEELPYESAYFDFVLARSAVFAFDIPRALREFHRVLKPGGRLWVSLHRWKDIRFILKNTWLAHPIKTTVFGTYVVTNSLTFHYTGKLIPYPLNRSRVMTFQTESRMRQELQTAGFGETRVSRTRFFVMESDKPGPLIRSKELPDQNVPVSIAG